MDEPIVSTTGKRRCKKNVQPVQRNHTRYSMSNEPTMLAHRRPTGGAGSLRRYGEGEDGLQEMLILLEYCEQQLIISWGNLYHMKIT